MKNLNNYKKIQVILIILIIIASILLIISAVKTKKEKNYLAETTFSEITDVVEENTVEVDSNEEVIEEAEDTSWDEDAEDTKVDVNEEQNSEEKNEMPYYIKINYKANCITVYKKDSSGKYTVPVKAIICSTGTATPTSGVYKMGQKYRWHQLNGGVYGQYCSRITGHILFHSVPYSKNSPDSLKYVAYDKLGTKASAGCIRLTTADAIWIYNNCPSGTYVEFYASSDPGPLGKPSAQKISSNVECRNWDPTDPTKGNPWHTYTPKVEETYIQEETKPNVVEENKKEENNPIEDTTNNNNNQENSTNTENKDKNENNIIEENVNKDSNNNSTNENNNEVIDSEQEKNEESKNEFTQDKDINS